MRIKRSKLRQVILEAFEEGDILLNEVWMVGARPFNSLSSLAEMGGHISPDDYPSAGQERKRNYDWNRDEYFEATSDPREVNKALDAVDNMMDAVESGVSSRGELLRMLNTIHMHLARTRKTDERLDETVQAGETGTTSGEEALAALLMSLTDNAQEVVGNVITALKRSEGKGERGVIDKIKAALGLEAKSDTAASDGKQTD